MMLKIIMQKITWNSNRLHHY